MFSKPSTRRFLVPVALLMVLVVGVMLGNVSHHHSGSSDANCSICHFSHQAVGQLEPTDCTATLAQVGVKFETQEPEFTPSPLKPRLPARAPPTA